MEKPNSSTKQTDKATPTVTPSKESNFDGFAPKSGCRRVNCQNPIESWDLHDFCLIHRSNMSRNTLCRRSRQCRMAEGEGQVRGEHLQVFSSTDLSPSRKRSNDESYHKFTRGKDLSRYNADDLACVLGSKRVKSNITEGEVEQQLVAPLNSEKFQEETEIGQTAKSHGLTTVHGGNLKDYFSQKMIELKRKRGEGIIGYTGDTDQSNEEMNDVSFPNLEFEPEKFSFSFNVSQSINEAGEEDKKSYSSKIKKSKKKDKECLEETIESMTPIKSKVEKKSKKKIKHLQTEILIEETVHTKNKKSKNGGHQKLDEFSEVEMAHKREKSFKKKKENMDSSENNDSGECRNSLVSEIKDCTYNANIDCHNSIAVENIEDCSVLPQGKKKNKKRKLEKNISNLECPIKGDIVNDADIHDIVEEENVANQSKELNDSYGIAMSVMNEKKRKHREGNSENRAPLKKIKKFTSELNLADLFKSSSSLVPCDEATAEGKSLPGKKIKLSAKKSFKELKSGMEAKLKRIKEICNEQDLPEKVTKDNSLNICNEKELTESNESALCGTNEANIRKFNGKINRPSLINIKEIEVNMNDIFPGSNLADIKGYD